MLKRTKGEEEKTFCWIKCAWNYPNWFVPCRWYTRTYALPFPPRLHPFLSVVHSGSRAHTKNLCFITSTRLKRTTFLSFYITEWNELPFGKLCAENDFHPICVWVCVCVCLFGWIAFYIHSRWLNNFLLLLANAWFSIAMRSVSAIVLRSVCASSCGKSRKMLSTSTLVNALWIRFFVYGTVNLQL